MLQNTIGNTGNLIVHCGDENLINFLRQNTRINGFPIRDFEKSRQFIRRRSDTPNFFCLLSDIQDFVRMKKIEGVFLVGHSNCRIYDEDETPLSPDDDRNRQIAELEKLKKDLLSFLKIKVPFGIFICETK